MVELGAGDASKSVHLLRGMMAAGAELTYYPVDISRNVINDLEARLPQEIAGLDVQGLCGEYLPMMQACNERSQRRKVILFMGANIGNMLPGEAADFCRRLRAGMGDDDMLILGFDLVKMPQKILAAYNDAGGFTRAFNLNLLRRINEELNADFDVSAFAHYPTYDPASGACKSFLVSMKAQTVHLGEYQFSFTEGEAVYTEISQKYTIAETDALASAAGFTAMQPILDNTGGFLVAVWKCRQA